MKKLILIIAVACTTTFIRAERTFTSAADYSSFVNGHQEKVDELFNHLNELTAADPSKMTDIMVAFNSMKEQCFSSINEMKDVKVFGNGDGLRDACIDILQLYSTYGERVLVDYLADLNNPLVTVEELNRLDAELVAFYDEVTAKVIEYSLIKFNYDVSNGKVGSL